MNVGRQEVGYPDIFVQLKTKHDEITAPRPKCFVPGWDYRNQKTTIPKNYPGEDEFCTLENNDGGET